jgi:hypothetical protein
MYQLKLQIAVQDEKNFASVGQLLETQEQSPQQLSERFVGFITMVLKKS